VTGALTILVNITTQWRRSCFVSWTSSHWHTGFVACTRTRVLWIDNAAGYTPQWVSTCWRDACLNARSQRINRVLWLKTYHPADDQFFHRCHFCLETVDIVKPYNRKLTGNHICPVERHPYQWPWVTLKFCLRPFQLLFITRCVYNARHMLLLIPSVCQKWKTF